MISTPPFAQVRITASASTVWRHLNQPGNLKLCHPFCASTDVERWPGVGARDSITYYSGRTHHRNFVGWHEGEGYDIELGEPPMRTARVEWRIASEGENRSRMSIEVFPLFPDDFPKEKKQRILAREFGADLQHYLTCVVKGIAYWVETGAAVKEDQFGWNPIFSRPRDA